jgi:putative membrane protein
VPSQDDAAVATLPRVLLATAAAGTVGAALVGYLPGVSAAVAAVLALPLVPGGAGDRGYVIATSGTNSATTVFGLFALAAFDTPRTGVYVAYQSVGAPVALATLVAVVVLAGAWGVAAVLLVGDRYLRWVGRVDYRRLSVAVCGLLAALSWLFAGAVGVGVLVASAVVGLVPVRLGVKRVHLMGVLIGPLIVG